MTDAEKKLLQAQHRLEEAQAQRSESRSAKPEHAGSFRRVRFWKRCCQRCGRWSRLCWRGIFHGSWENKSEFQMGGLRETGGLPLFLPKGALTHHL